MVLTGVGGRFAGVVQRSREHIRAGLHRRRHTGRVGVLMVMRCVRKRFPGVVGRAGGGRMGNRGSLLPVLSTVYHIVRQRFLVEIRRVEITVRVRFVHLLRNYRMIDRVGAALDATACVCAGLLFQVGQVLVQRDHVVVVAAQSVRVECLTRVVSRLLSHGAAVEAHAATVDFVEAVAVRGPVTLVIVCRVAIGCHFGLLGHRSIRQSVRVAMTRLWLVQRAILLLLMNGLGRGERVVRVSGHAAVQRVDLIGRRRRGRRGRGRSRRVGHGNGR